MTEWITVVDMLRADADAEWRQWLQTHDISELRPEDIRIDIGRGPEGRDFKRYSIRDTAMPKIRLLPKSGEDG